MSSRQLTVIKAQKEVRFGIVKTRNVNQVSKEICCRRREMGRGKSVMLVSKILFWVSDLVELLVSVLWLEVGTLLSSCLWGVV